MYCNTALAWYEHDLDVAYDMEQRGITDIDKYYEILEQEENAVKRRFGQSA